MEAQIVVADPDGRGSVTLWIALDLRLRLWRWTVHLHSFLNQSKGISAPKDLLPWLYPYLTNWSWCFSSCSRYS